MAVTPESRFDHHYSQLIQLFRECFEKQYQTCLVRGGAEPVYLPQSEGRLFSEIHFAHGFFSSALHECAHWMLAGEQRRRLEDFGYWYQPDGRNAEQQRLFEAVEVKPQAIEWMLSVAAGYRFRVSIDNLQGEATDPARFKQAVYQQVRHYLVQGLPGRAEQFRQALCEYYGTPRKLSLTQFDVETI
ncbi:elongation factor P hydroxylase [Ketobacter sp. MCCC 1A13808]|uniref:elongation factor P hydroxylase n=1 Tax=Ketobacter sp. MCCC 1A13808 TaxID=2602738 RepID=UPI0012EBA6B8|nr:elongation factor P hydroxylase [Ketobacter sp. MCCC 1A13808]MVF12659.1 elongation factor P hydroxylase [Ketobacter sp. MCCC 1A13808]